MAVNESGGAGMSSEEARIAALYRQAALEEPPRHIDAAIAAAARRPARAPLRQKPGAWWTIWRIPFAVAAVAVVSASLVTLMMEQGEERLAVAPEAPAPRVDERRAAAVESQADEAEPAREARRERDRRSERQARRAAPPRPAAVPGDGPVSSQSPTASPPSASPPQTKPLSAEPQAKALALEPPSGARDARMLSAEKPAAREARDHSGLTGSVAKSSPAPAVSAPPAAALKRSDRAEAAAPVAAQLIAELEREPPGQWIERILTLRRDGRRQEADALLAEFRRRFPDELLPPGLQ